MKTSVCIFFNDNDAKVMVGLLRKKHLGVTLENRPAILENGEELLLSVLSAERPEHPLILDRVAEMDSMHETLVRCGCCQSARLSVGLDDGSPPAVKLARMFLQKFARRPQVSPQAIVCRDCNTPVTVADPQLPPPPGAQPVFNAIAA